MVNTGSVLPGSPAQTSCGRRRCLSGAGNSWWRPGTWAAAWPRGPSPENLQSQSRDLQIGISPATVWYRFCRVVPGSPAHATSVPPGPCPTWRRHRHTASSSPFCRAPCQIVGCKRRHWLENLVALQGNLVATRQQGLVASLQGLVVLVATRFSCSTRPCATRKPCGHKDHKAL